MTAITDDYFFAFKNVGGYLSLRLYGDNVSVSRITIKGNNGEKIAGKASITMPLGGVPSIVMDETATDEISIVCDTPVTIGSSITDYTDFWFVIPPVTFEQGFTITVTNDLGGTFTKSTSKSFTVSRNQLDWMNPLKVEPDFNIFNIEFADPLVKEICVVNWDTNKDGELSNSEAAKVTSIVNCFTEQDICSFDEFRYFINVKDVPAYGFRLCTNLSSIVLPSSIDHIGNFAFESCTHLLSVKLSRGLSHIGLSAFRKCTRLKTISVPDGVDTIEKYAFNDCGSLESIDLPNSICSLGEGAFWGCNNLVSIRIPNELTRIEKRMFSGCVALSEVSFSECIVDIGDHAFFDCNSLTFLTIPKTIKNIGYASFLYCTGLLAITILAENPPTLLGEEYDGLTFDATNECPIFVPANSIEAYQTASIWDVYASRIKAIPE